MSSKKGKVLEDSMVAQISAAIYYQTKVVSKLTGNREFQNLFTRTIFDQIEEDFGLYLDALARSKPKSLHHVYEWKMVGNKNARLFDLKMISKSGVSFKLGYNFIPSKSTVPLKNTKHKHVFANKAVIMEKGQPVKITPRSSERLVFEGMDGKTVFMPKGASVVVNRPGGKAATNQFSLAYARFFSGNLVNLSIKKSGFQKTFGRNMAQAMKLPADIKRVKYSFSPNTLNVKAEAAVAAAFGRGIL